MAALLATSAECSPAHVHSSSCGHATFTHGNHVDYIVGTRLHHVDGDGCTEHGEVRAVEESDVVMATAASRLIRRRGGSLSLSRNALRAPSALVVEAQASKANTYRFMAGLVLTATFMLVEFVVGLMINSLALQVRSHACFYAHRLTVVRLLLCFTGRRVSHGKRRRLDGDRMVCVSRDGRGKDCPRNIWLSAP